MDDIALIFHTDKEEESVELDLLNDKYRIYYQTKVHISNHIIGVYIWMYSDYESKLAAVDRRPHDYCQESF